MREGCSALPHFLHVVQESLGDGEGEYRRESPPPFSEERHGSDSGPCRK